MSPITIPKNLAKNDDLVVIPRKEYEELLKTAKKSADHKKHKQELDQALAEAMEEVRQGKVYGPFSSTEELMRSLEEWNPYIRRDSAKISSSFRLIYNASSQNSMTIYYLI